MNHNRSIIRIQINKSAKNRLESLCDQRGMTQIATVSRLVAWFANQDETSQATILGLLPQPPSDELARNVLKHMLASHSSCVNANIK